MYTRIPYWVQSYASGGITDSHAVQLFMDCETTEMINSLRNELVGIAQGNFSEDILDNVVGQGRKVKYGSYLEWSKMMLLWMASYKG